MNTICKECGKPVAGRTDKQFCSKECKNRYNNRKNAEIARNRKDVIRSLDRNHEILRSLCAAGVFSAKIEDLCRIGFKADAVTSQRKGRCGHCECSCYDIIYFRTETKIFDIHAADVNPGKSP